MLVYTVTIHAVRKALAISPIEYMLCDMIYHLSNNKSSSCTGWCYASRTTLAAELCITKKATVDMIERMIVKGLIERHPQTKHLRSSQKWDSYFTNNGGIETTPTVRKEPVLPPSDKPENRYRNYTDGIGTTPNIYSNINTEQPNTNINKLESPLSQRSRGLIAELEIEQQPRIEENSFSALPEPQHGVSRNTTPETTNTNSMELSFDAQVETQESAQPQTPTAEPKKKRKVSDPSGAAAKPKKPKTENIAQIEEMYVLLNDFRASSPKYGFVRPDGTIVYVERTGKEYGAAQNLYRIMRDRVAASRKQTSLNPEPVTGADVVEEFKQTLTYAKFNYDRAVGEYNKQLFNFSHLVLKYSIIEANALKDGFKPKQAEDPLKPKLGIGYTPMLFGAELKGMIEAGKITREVALEAYNNYDALYRKTFAKY